MVVVFCLNMWMLIFYSGVSLIHVILFVAGVQMFLASPDDYQEILKAGIRKDSFYGYISLWVTILLQLYFYLCLYLKLKSDDKSEWLHQIKNTTFHSLIIPLNVMTCGGFWMLFLYDRNCILPPVMDSLVPQWTNHVVHTMPPVIILIQMFWSHDNVSCKSCYSVPSKRKSFVILNIALIIYIILLLKIYFAEGRWVYFGLKYLSPLQIIAVITAAYLTCLIAHHVGYTLHCAIAKQRHPNMVGLQAKDK